MSKGEKKNKKSGKDCGSKRGLMLAFGLTTLSARAISAISKKRQSCLTNALKRSEKVVRQLLMLFAFVTGDK